MAAKVCVVAGAGPGTEAALCRRFAAGGYRVAMLARNAERLASVVDREAAGAAPVSVSASVLELSRIQTTRVDYGLSSRAAEHRL